MSFHLLRFFWLKIQQYYIFGKTKEKNKETGYFENKTLSSFRKASSTKIEYAKYPGDSQVACLVYLNYPLHTICVGLNSKLAVFILQMHCQMKLRGSPCSVFSCCNPKISTTVSWDSFFSCGCLVLMLDCNGFEGLHQYRFSFLYRNPLVQRHLRPAARHFTESSLTWSFLWFLEQSLVLEEILEFYASYYLGYLWKQSLPLERVRFFLMIANCVHANIGISVHIWTWIYLFTKL